MFMQQNTRETRTAGGPNNLVSKRANSRKQRENWTIRTRDSPLSSVSYWVRCRKKNRPTLNLLTGMNSQLEANVQALSRAQQDKTFNESLLTQQEASAAIVVPGARGARDARATTQCIGRPTGRLAGALHRRTPRRR